MRTKRQGFVKKVAWVNSDSERNKVTNVLAQIPRYVGDNVVPDEYLPLLVPGSLWTSNKTFYCMFDETRSNDVKIAKITNRRLLGEEIERIYHAPSVFIYIGMDRREEVNKAKKKLQVFRHVFFADGVRYIITNLDALNPM